MGERLRLRPCCVCLHERPDHGAARHRKNRRRLLQVNRAGGQIPGMSYGGAKQSGIGAEYSIEGALEAYTSRKSVTINV
jgi:acyl-CoA reductase-like NAD-dependent aldehyde dehydrogenase